MTKAGNDVTVAVPGPLRVRVGDHEVPVGGPRTVLAPLVAADGQRVPAATLIEQV